MFAVFFHFGHVAQCTLLVWVAENLLWQSKHALLSLDSLMCFGFVFVFHFHKLLHSLMMVEVVRPCHLNISVFFSPWCDSDDRLGIETCWLKSHKLYIAFAITNVSFLPFFSFLSYIPFRIFPCIPSLTCAHPSMFELLPDPWRNSLCNHNFAMQQGIIILHLKQKRAATLYTFII